MLRHYARVAWRNLGRHRTTTFIHLTGFTLSAGFCLLSFAECQETRRAIHHRIELQWWMSGAVSLRSE